MLFSLEELSFMFNHHESLQTSHENVLSLQKLHKRFQMNSISVNIFCSKIREMDINIPNNIDKIPTWGGKVIVGRNTDVEIIIHVRNYFLN